MKAELIAPPGTRWHYSSATTQILARVIRDAVGGPEQTLAFAWRELFNPLGMRIVTLEFDGSGTVQGTTNMSASMDVRRGASAKAFRATRSLPPAISANAS